MKAAPPLPTPGFINLRFESSGFFQLPWTTLEENIMYVKRRTACYQGAFQVEYFSFEMSLPTPTIPETKVRSGFLGVINFYVAYS